MANEARPSETASSAGRPAPPAATAGAAEMKEQAARQASRIAEEAKQRGRTLVDEQKSNAARQLSGLASALRDTAVRCQEREDQRTVGRALEQVAGGLDRFADMLDERDVDSLMNQMTSMVRRQPALFIGGTIAAGFLLSRFVKSSSQRAQGAQEYGSGQGAGYEAGYDEEAYLGVETDSPSYVTSAHVDPDEVGRERPGGVPPVTPTGRRDY